MAQDSRAWLKIASDSCYPSMAQDSLQEVSGKLAIHFGWAGGDTRSVKNLFYVQAVDPPRGKKPKGMRRSTDPVR
eukprot:4001713-Pyramimonas_sp.AAC.1